jgi:hypothetical protein
MPWIEISNQMLKDSADPVSRMRNSKEKRWHHPLGAA